MIISLICFLLTNAISLSSAEWYIGEGVTILIVVRPKTIGVKFIGCIPVFLIAVQIENM